MLTHAALVEEALGVAFGDDGAHLALVTSSIGTSTTAVLEGGM
jgi:hypothetical protein